MRATKFRFLALAAVAVFASGCFSVRHSYNGDKILTTDGSIPGVTLRPAGHFEAHDRQFFWLHGGIPVGENLNGAALAAKAAGEHDGVVNLKLSDGQDFTDMAISHVACVLTLLCGTWSVWVEGDVVDLEDGR
ncbi:MAG: hypothetical protein GY725_17705 [bacterium]|nr:hypothetical protein [bacterium]